MRPPASRLRRCRSPSSTKPTPRTRRAASRGRAFSWRKFRVIPRSRSKRTAISAPCARCAGLRGCPAPSCASPARARTTITTGCSRCCPSFSFSASRAPCRSNPPSTSKRIIPSSVTRFSSRAFPRPLSSIAGRPKPSGPTGFSSPPFPRPPAWRIHGRWTGCAGRCCPAWRPRALRRRSPASSSLVKAPGTGAL